MDIHFCSFGEVDLFLKLKAMLIYTLANCLCLSNYLHVYKFALNTIINSTTNVLWRAVLWIRNDFFRIRILLISFSEYFFFNWFWIWSCPLFPDHSNSLRSDRIRIWIRIHNTVWCRYGGAFCLTHLPTSLYAEQRRWESYHWNQ